MTNPDGETTTALPSSLEIAQAAKLRPILQIAEYLGIPEEYVEPYGRYKAKVSLEVLDYLQNRPKGKYVVVTAITPTPLGEGKTTTAIGLAQALTRIGKLAVVTVRQPSVGPLLGVKGGGTGGGYSQILPMEDVNLHLTGDTHAVALATNLLAAFIDNHLHHGNKLDIDPHSITWRRAVDVNDRALRYIVVGLGGPEGGIPRESGFDIAAASEVMAILALTTGLQDLRRRLGRIVVGISRDGRPVTAEDLRCAGAMAVLMRDAIKPNLVQTLENTPAFVHAGPFGNIAHGNSSILADQVSLRLADFTVTESGFGADLGFEKFCNIKCRMSGDYPDVALVVCTLRGLKSHAGQFRIAAGRPLDPGLTEENPEALRQGIANLVKQIENVRAFGVPAVVAINRFPTDTEREIAIVREAALEAGAFAAHASDHFRLGGAGAEALAQAVAEAAGQPGEFQFLYPLEAPIKVKIETIATRLYGADGVDYATKANQQIDRWTRTGYDRLPVCMAKTHLSLSDDARLKGRPQNFTVSVRDLGLSAGAGFLYALLGDIRTMPGLPSRPAGEDVDIDEHGRVVGLF